jgi:hypothetical protein
MGFIEHARISFNNNRSMLRSTVDKYFRGPHRLAVNEKTDLAKAKLHFANAERNRRIFLAYLTFALAALVVLILILILA